MKLDRVIAVRNTKTVYRDGGRCIKVFARSHAKSEVFDEALAMTRVEEAGINAPRVLEVSSAEGKWAIVYEYIEGDSMARLMEKDADKIPGYMEWFADIHLSLRRHSCPGLRRLGDRLRERISEARLEAETKAELYLRLEKMPDGDSICHGDFYPTNIIVPDDGVPYIIDWDSVTLGNIAAYAAWTYLRFMLDGDSAGAELYLDLFCRKSGVEAPQVRSWLPIVAGAQTAKAGADRRGRLLRWITPETEGR